MAEFSRKAKKLSRLPSPKQSSKRLRISAGQNPHPSRSQCIGSSPKLPPPMPGFFGKVKKMSRSPSPMQSLNGLRNSSGLNPHPLRSQSIGSSPELPPPMAEFSDLPTSRPQDHERRRTSRSGTPRPPPSRKNPTPSQSTPPTRSNPSAARRGRQLRHLPRRGR
ncbi:hypothetical protein EUGRSUZ_H03685 [Eucalyptus grandis]|uniref:Uncharacterized protein n=2 Tax=Eucalyptus grandis TaxID=71139 RepID=A0A059B4C6_EUCGR|nr:hypothetical protein EUGRSUZ_H03685 [Eucalyptus grandis]